MFCKIIYYALFPILTFAKSTPALTPVNRIDATKTIFDILFYILLQNSAPPTGKWKLYKALGSFPGLSLMLSNGHCFRFHAHRLEAYDYCFPSFFLVLAFARSDCHCCHYYYCFHFPDLELAWSSPLE